MHRFTAVAREQPLVGGAGRIILERPRDPRILKPHPRSPRRARLLDLRTVFMVGDCMTYSECLDDLPPGASAVQNPHFSKHTHACCHSPGCSICYMIRGQRMEKCAIQPTPGHKSCRVTLSTQTSGTRPCICARSDAQTQGAGDTHKRTDGELLAARTVGPMATRKSVVC